MRHRVSLEARDGEVAASVTASLVEVLGAGKEAEAEEGAVEVEAGGEVVDLVADLVAVVVEAAVVTEVAAMVEDTEDIRSVSCGAVFRSNTYNSRTQTVADLITNF